MDMKHNSVFKKLACFKVLLYNNVPGTIKKTNYLFFS